MGSLQGSRVKIRGHVIAHGTPLSHRTIYIGAVLTFQRLRSYDLMALYKSVYYYKCKKLNSLKHLVRTTVTWLDHNTKTANIKKALLLSSTSPFSQCADK